MSDVDRIEKELKKKWKRNEKELKKKWKRVQIEKGNESPKKKREIKVQIDKGKIVQIEIGKSKLAEEKKNHS
jgi:hypothetical protein